MLNRGSSYTIVPADEKIDPALVMRMDIDDLDKYGKSEIVSTVYKCMALVAEDTAPEVKKQMGPFGEVIVLHQANQLIMQDTVGNLMRIKEQLDSQEVSEQKGQAETFAHKCVYIRARDAESILRNFLGETKTVTEVVKGPTAGATTPGAGGPGGLDDPNAMDFSGGGKGGKGGKGGGGFGGNFGAAGNVTQRVRSYNITSDERTNTVLVNGSPDKIAQAKTIIKQIDVGTVPFVIGAPVLQTYPIKEGNAIELAKTLIEIHKGSSGIKIAPSATINCMCWLRRKTKSPSPARSTARVRRQPKPS